MREMRGHIEAAERNENSRTTGARRPVAWSMTATARPHKISNFKAKLLAIAGHDLRQPLQVIQSVHEILGLGVRTSSELRRLRSGQNAIDRLKEQLERILTALRVRERSRRLELRPLRGHQVLRQARRENEQAGFNKGMMRNALARQRISSVDMRNADNGLFNVDPVDLDETIRGNQVTELGSPFLPRG
jgi:two-component system, OmpR family, phosphate regulon sensor histidine kinase PhoR